LAVVVLTNRHGGQLLKIVDTACELFLPLKPPQNESPPEAEEISLAEMQEYLGVYKNGAAERVEAIKRDGKLIVRDNSPGVEIFNRGGKLFLRRGESELPITKIGERLFMAQSPRANLPDEFVMLPDRSGKITYLQIGDTALKRQE